MYRSRFLIVFPLLSLFLACGDSLTRAERNQSLIAQDGLQVGLVISPDGEASGSHFLTLAADSTALDALEAAPVTLVTQDFGFGVALCAIDGVGNSSDACLGDPDPTLTQFWAFYVLDEEGAWGQALEGVGEYRAQDGDVLGFAWTGVDVNFNPLREPPVLDLVDLAE